MSSITGHHSDQLIRSASRLRQTTRSVADEHARPGSDSAAWQGARAMLPWLVGIAPLGMIVGATAAANELSVAVALVSGALIFSGPAQLTALELLGQGAGIAAVVATVVLMNVHLLIIGSSIAPHCRGTPSVSYKNIRAHET